MKNKESIQSLLEDRLIEQILRILLKTFKLEENFLQLSQRLKTSRPTLKNKIDLLVDNEIIVKDKTKVRISTDIDMFMLLDKELPIDIQSKNYKKERLQRELVCQYIIKHKDPNNFFKLRPNDNFDIRESIHPSISISNKLEITEASDSFFKLFGDDVPDGIERRYLFDFFEDVNIYHYDFKSDVIANELVYTKMYKALIDNGFVKLDACYIKKSGKKIFLSIFVIIQANFIGMQSIMTDITERVTSQRVQKRLTHRFYHLISVVDTISDKLMALDIEDNEFRFLTKQLDKLSSFDYLENVYVNNIGGDIESYRDFKLNKNLKSIVEQLRFLYDISKKELSFEGGDRLLKVSNVYDIYLYEGLYLLIEGLIARSSSGCDCAISTYEKNKKAFIQISFSQKINSEIEEFIKALKSEILKNSCINKNHLHLKIFLDELPKKAILELVVSSYFDVILVSDEDKSVVFEFKDTASGVSVN